MYGVYGATARSSPLKRNERNAETATPSSLTMSLTHEAEQAGMAALEPMLAQREQLESSYLKVKETKEVVSKAKKTLSKAERSAMRTLVILYTIIVILVVLIVLVVWREVTNHGRLL